MLMFMITVLMWSPGCSGIDFGKVLPVLAGLTPLP